jgi:hypothetical protein
MNFIAWSTKSADIYLKIQSTFKILKRTFILFQEIILENTNYFYDKNLSWNFSINSKLSLRIYIAIAISLNINLDKSKNLGPFN